MSRFTVLLLLVPTLALLAQDDSRQRVREVSDLAKQGTEAIPKLAEYLKDPSVEVRAAAVKSLARIGTNRSLDPLVKAAQDADPEVQHRAIDGMVNFYLPGYLDSSFSDTIKRNEDGVSGRFPDKDEWIIAPYIEVRNDVVQAIRGLARSSPSLAIRANAARAAGSLRMLSAVPELSEGLRSKDDALIYQSILAIQKMRAVAAAPRLGFLTRDPDERVQLLAIETAGLLGDKQLLPDLQRVLENNPKAKVRKAVITAMAMLPDPSNRPLFQQSLTDKDDTIRAAAAEGLGRLGNVEDLNRVDAAWQAERKGSVQLAMAFAEISLGNHELSEQSPLQSLVNNLNSKSWKGIASAYLTELARKPSIRSALYPVLGAGTKEERIGLAQALGASGAADAIDPLDRLSKDSDPDIAAAGLRALRTVKAKRP